jgi:hypothetical protein
MYHFFSLDEVAFSEIPTLIDTVKQDYENSLILIAQTIFGWFKGLQVAILEKPISDIQPTDKDKMKRIRGGDRLLQKATFTLTELTKLGTIRVIDTDHHCLFEVAGQVENLVKIMFTIEKTPYSPIELSRRLEVAKWSFQQICAAAGFNFCQALTRNLVSLASSDDQMGSLALIYRDQYVHIAKEILPHVFFSNTQEMFVSAGSKSSPSSTAGYLSLPAFHALRDFIGTSGCVMIYKALAEVVCLLVRDFISMVTKLLTGPSAVYDTGILQVQDPNVIIGKLGHVSAVLRLREMVRQFTGEAKLAPHEDFDLLTPLTPLMQELFDNPATVTLFASLFGNSYWDSFDYDVSHDAVKDNSHLWARFFDLFIACAGHSHSQVTPNLFYRQLFLQALMSMQKASVHFGRTRKGQNQGLELAILVDHLVSESYYANYAQLEQFMAYQFIRSLYTAKLSRIGK